MIGRREFITLIGGTAAWPVVGRAQQIERVRHVCVLAQQPESDPEDRKRMVAFLQALQNLGWREGENIRIQSRHALGKLENARKYAVELAALMPDVILAAGGVATGPLIQATRTVPIVFVFVPDPVEAGFVESLARPGGNATGFSQFEYALSGKWLELLKEIVPRMRQVGVLRDFQAGGSAQFGAIQGAAAPLGIEVTPIGVREAGEVERAVIAFARKPDGGLISTGSPLTTLHRDLIIQLAARYRLPTVYSSRFHATGGGLISYGADLVDQYRQAAGYVDRILKGEKPADLPVQAPTKYELVINMKTAKALGLEVPPTVLALADEVIE
jgi:putative tryptophan/tyrosine transport system substrate-binding protein